MHRRISLPQAFRFLPAVLLMAAALCAPALAADLNLATGSPSVGFTFDDKPLSLPVQENFQMALLTASGELGRTCGKTEAYGWRMKQSEQERVDQIFSSTVDRLRALGYVVETQTPASISHDVTLFSADKPDKHFIFMWSAGEIGLVMVLCESSPPLMNHNGTASYVGENPSVKSFPVPGEAVVASELKTPVRDKATMAAAARFSPIGTWTGTYACAQGVTGGTLQIGNLKGKNFDGTFRFYALPKNPNVVGGSYKVYGQYDKISNRILINPGKWIHRPPGYYDTIMVGSFDPVAHSFSAYFQGITGCTSFEAKSGAGIHKELLAESKAAKTSKKSKKKKAAATKKTAKSVAPVELTKSKVPASAAGITPDSTTPAAIPPAAPQPAPTLQPTPAAGPLPVAPAAAVPPSPARAMPNPPAAMPVPSGPVSQQPVPPLPSQIEPVPPAPPAPVPAANTPMPSTPPPAAPPAH